jgi:hypothetical protein
MQDTYEAYNQRLTIANIIYINSIGAELTIHKLKDDSGKESKEL